jgi:hypothetical protein
MTNGAAVGLTLMAICADPDEAHQCWRNLGPLRDEGVRTIVVMTGIPAKLYFKARGSSYWRRIGHALAQVGIARPTPDPHQWQLLERVQQQITTTIDVTEVIDRKRTALFAHASQLSSSLATKIAPELWPRVFGAETFVRAHDTARTPTPEGDLFAGLRSGWREATAED